METKNLTSAMSTSLQIDRLPTFTIKDERRKSAELIGLRSSDIQSRSLNILRSTFLKRIKEGGKQLIGITSASPAEGKTFLTVNLGLSLAKVCPEPVFLIDLDFRRPSLASTLGMEVEHSIEDYLTGKVDDLSKVGARIKNANLAVFPSLKTKRTSTELLSCDRFAEMLTIFKEDSQASIMLFDLPPAFADDDAMISLEHLDGYILTVEASRTTARQVEQTIEILSPSECIGTVLNRYQGGLGDPYGYGGYESYYD